MRPPELVAEVLEDALVGSPGRFTRELLADVWGDHHAQGRVLRAFREARWIGSARRRPVRELFFAVVRSSRWLEGALRAGGWSGERRVEALWTRMIVACGLPSSRAAEVFGEDVFGAECVLPEGRRERLALQGSLPEWFVDDLEDLDVAERFVSALDDRAPLTLRCNAPVEEVLAELRASGLAVQRTRFALYGLVVAGRTALGDHDAWRQGRVEVQDEGSQLVAELVKPPRRSRVVDLCAGAGGKSLAVLARAPRGVRVEALDVRSSALKQARSRARRAGVELATRRIDPAAPIDVRPAARVLVDAPCTGSGTLRRNPMLRWRLSPPWRDGQVALQRDLLRRAAAIVRPGGRLIYATCSVLRPENQDQVEDFLAAHPGFSVVPIAEPLGSARAADLGGPYLQLESDVHGTDGFFAAVLQRGG